MSKTQSVFKYMKGVVRQAVGMKSKSKPTEEESSLQASVVKSTDDGSEDYELVESNMDEYNEYKFEKYEILDYFETVTAKLSPDLRPAIESILKDSTNGTITTKKFFMEILNLASEPTFSIPTFLNLALGDPSIYSEICKEKMEDIAKLYIDSFFELEIDFSCRDTIIIYKETVKRGLTEVVKHIVNHDPDKPTLHWKHILPLAIKYSRLSIVELYIEYDVPPIDALYDKHANLRLNDVFTILNLSLGYVFVLGKELIDQNTTTQTYKTKMDNKYNLQISEMLSCIKVLLDSNKTFIHFRENVAKKTYDILKSIGNFVSNNPNSFDDSTKLLLFGVQNSVKYKFIGLEYTEDKKMTRVIEKIILLEDIRFSTMEPNIEDTLENESISDLEMTFIDTDLLGNKLEESS